ncbi:DUF423 domain-containing protein [Roseibium sp. RKSG952]|uniref:DUF423 domain-containing protein n=1 Tax=Roseibium sp. RKSG952 TaxID=2529384 RepID=UPI0012BB718F|nr:DUF423 domain-containing protein [Roseibium sp. RKSG952]MTH98326.1 DUF423 domain-containing protein [Roseibium sp. RKSG952]
MSDPIPPAIQSPTSAILRFSLILGGVSGACGVTLMALAAHLDTTGLLSTAAQMLLFHAPVIIGLGVLTQVRRAPFAPIAILLLVAGLGLFSGDLASRALTDQRLFANSAPTGGMLLIAGWLATALSALRLKER